MNTKVKDVMTHLVVTLKPTDTLHEAARRLARNHISGAPVVEHGRVVGVISETDVVKALAPVFAGRRTASVLDWLTNSARATSRAHAGTEVADAMSPLVVEIDQDASVWEGAEKMSRYGINRLPVVDEEGYLVGIVTRSDLVRIMGRDDSVIEADVRDALEAFEDAFEDLEVEVDEGIVRLSGRADRKTTKQIAARLARRVPGITKVADDLTFELDDTKLRIARHERAVDMGLANRLAN